MFFITTQTRSGEQHLLHRPDRISTTTLLSAMRMSRSVACSTALPTDKIRVAEQVAGFDVAMWSHEPWFARKCNDQRPQRKWLVMVEHDRQYDPIFFNDSGQPVYSLFDTATIFPSARQASVNTNRAGLLCHLTRADVAIQDYARHYLTRDEFGDARRHNQELTPRFGIYRSGFVVAADLPEYDAAFYGWTADEQLGVVHSVHNLVAFSSQDVATNLCLAMYKFGPKNVNWGVLYRHYGGDDYFVAPQRAPLEPQVVDDEWQPVGRVAVPHLRYGDRFMGERHDPQVLVALYHIQDTIIAVKPEIFANQPAEIHRHLYLIESRDIVAVQRREQHAAADARRSISLEDPCSA